ncbi:hypothetical protein Tco_0793347 [Tanacetum coccineum]
MSLVTMADEITLESLTEEQFECFIECYHENYQEDFNSDLENLKEIYKMMNGGVKYPRTQNASPSEIKEPYEPSPRMYSYEQPSCLGSNFVGETLRESDQLHQTFKKSSTTMTHKLDDMIELPKSQPKITYKGDLECIMKDKVDNPSPQCTPQVLLSIDLYTPHVTHPEEVEETIGIQMEVEPLDHMKLEDLVLNTNTHDLFLSSKGFSNVDEPEPQFLPNFSLLDINLGDKRGTDPPINPYSPGSFRMRVVKPLTIHTPPLPHVAYLHRNGNEISPNMGKSKFNSSYVKAEQSEEYVYEEHDEVVDEEAEKSGEAEGNEEVEEKERVSKRKKHVTKRYLSNSDSSSKDERVSNLSIDTLPSHLARFAVSKFNNISYEFMLDKGTIVLTAKKVHERPIDDKFVQFWFKEMCAKLLKDIRLTDIVSKLVLTKRINFMFKVNFLMLFANTMGEADTINAIVNLTILRRIQEDTKISDID